MISSDLWIWNYADFAAFLCLKSCVSLRVQPMSPSKFAGKPPSWAMLSAANLVIFSIFSRFDIRWHLQVWLSSVPQLFLCGLILLMSIIRDQQRALTEGSNTPNCSKCCFILTILPIWCILQTVKYVLTACRCLFAWHSVRYFILCFFVAGVPCLASLFLWSDIGWASFVTISRHLSMLHISQCQAGENKFTHTS